MHKATDIDSFILEFPEAVQEKLQQLRATIREAAPNATESISYGIPTFLLAGNLVHFAAYKNHIGFYPGSTGVRDFADELIPYKTAKGSIQFPLNQPLPLDLIRDIVTRRVSQNLEKAAVKKKTRTCPAGHKYYKTTDCPTCPHCEKTKVPQAEFLAPLGAPARRALENQGITTLTRLAEYTEPEILKLHGLGPASLPKLREALMAAALSFKK